MSEAYHVREIAEQNSEICTLRCILHVIRQILVSKGFVTNFSIAVSAELHP